MCRRLLYRISLRQSHQNGRLLWVIVWLGAVANFTAEPQSSDDWEIEKASKNVRLSGGCNRMRHIMIYFYLLTFKCFLPTQDQLKVGTKQNTPQLASLWWTRKIPLGFRCWLKITGKKIVNLLFRLAQHVRQAPPSSAEYVLRREMSRKCAWKGRDTEI